MRNLFVILFSVLTLTSHSQKFDSELITKCLNSIYAMDFEEASINLNAYDTKFKNETSSLLLQAYLIRWQYSPITEDKDSIFKAYVSILDVVESKSKSLIELKKNDPIEAYYLMTSYIMRAELLALNGDFMKAALEGRKALQYIKKGFEWCEDYPEFYISTGLYNYYIEFYREKGFFYQSVLWPFPNGNKAQGLAFLKQGAQKAIFSEVETILYLSHLYFKMESDPHTSLEYISYLRERFPNNSKFVEMEVENLLALKRFSKAMTSLNTQSTNTEPNFLARKELFEGIALVNIGNDPAASSELLKSAMNKFDNLPGDNDHYISVAYYHLALLVYKNGDNELSEKYLKKAKDKVKYPYYKSEIETLATLF